MLENYILTKVPCGPFDSASSSCIGKEFSEHMVENYSRRIKFHPDMISSPMRWTQLSRSIISQLSTLRLGDFSMTRGFERVLTLFCVSLGVHSTLRLQYIMSKNEVECDVTPGYTLYSYSVSSTRAHRC